LPVLRILAAASFGAAPARSAVEAEAHTLAP